VEDVENELRQKLVELSEGALGSEQLDPSASMLDYGYIDSLSAARLLQFVEERFGVEVPQSQLVGEAHNLSGLVAYIERARSD